MTTNIATINPAIHQFRPAMANPTPINIDPKYNGLRRCEYGPLVVSCSFFVTCPEAIPRTNRPIAATDTPTMIDVIVGWASHTYTAAKANPSGTRMRRATADHLATIVLQQLQCGVNHFVRRNLEHAFIR